MSKVIILAGAPGSGKTTIKNILIDKRIESTAYVDLGHLRGMHLYRDWSNKSIQDEDIAFENLLFMTDNYIKHGYKNIVLLDLRFDKIKKLVEIYKDTCIVVSLIIEDDEELKRRVTTESRDSGYRDVDGAIAFNNELKSLQFGDNDVRIDNTHTNPEKTAQEVYELMEK